MSSLPPFKFSDLTKALVEVNRIQNYAQGQRSADLALHMGFKSANASQLSLPEQLEKHVKETMKTAEL